MKSTHLFFIIYTHAPRKAILVCVMSTFCQFVQQPNVDTLAIKSGRWSKIQSPARKKRSGLKDNAALLLKEWLCVPYAWENVLIEIASLHPTPKERKEEKHYVDKRNPPYIN
eukprot:1158887-Pelagomonas_calceolata.AAC.3